MLPHLLLSRCYDLTVEYAHLVRLQHLQRSLTDESVEQKGEQGRHLIWRVDQVRVIVSRRLICCSAVSRVTNGPSKVVRTERSERIVFLVHRVAAEFPQDPPAGFGDYQQSRYHSEADRSREGDVSYLKAENTISLNLVRQETRFRVTTYIRVRFSPAKAKAGGADAHWY